MARILQITDPHVIAPPGLVSGQLNTPALMAAAIDSILADMEKYGVIDAVLVTGDVTDDGALESFDWFRTQIERLELPYFLIPGNHDRRDLMRASFADQAFMPETGHINWMHDLPDLRLVGLDTLIPGQGSGILDQTTLEFLSDALRGRPDAPFLIAMHHPPFASGIRFMDELGLAGIEDLQRILHSAPNACRIICGHVHSMIVSTVGPATAIACPSISSHFKTDLRNDAPVGFMSGPTGYMLHDWNDGFCSTGIPLSKAQGPFPF